MPKAESTAKHTPWTVDPGQTSIRAGRNLVTTVCGDFTLARDVEHAARIVADHNALAGMDPSKVAGLVEAAREAADILGEMDQYPTLRTALAALTMEGSK